MRLVSLLSWVLVASTLDPGSAFARGGSHRWPRWPTELDRVVAPLRDELQRDRDHERIDALLGLDAYATPLVEPWLLRALGDPSTSVKREALRICFERELITCVPSALAIWSSVTEPMLRVAALRVVGMDPSGAGLDALLGALRDDSDAMRAQASAVLGAAALHGSARTRATAALLAKLADLSAVVRQNAVEALGSIGSADATLPIARLLEDAEPAVRLAAARALGQIGDGRAVAATVRALGSANEPAVVRAIVAALAVLPGEAAAEALLAAFDEPPPGVGATDVADLLSLRPAPEAVVLEGLATRLRDPSGGRLALRTLAGLGDRGIDVLQAELDRGASPDLALEIGRVIAGARVDVQPGRTHRPEVIPAPRGGDDGLAVRKQGALAEAIAELDALVPTRDWGPLLDATFLRGGAVTDRRVELALAVAVGPRARLGRWDRRGIATLIGWASDPSALARDRCLALLAMASVDAHAIGVRAVRLAAAEALGDVDPRVRACAVAPWHALARKPDVRAMLDPDPRVRTIAILLAARRGAERDETTTIALLAATDPDTHVRAAARWANAARKRGARGRAWIHGGALDPAGRWMRVRVGEAVLWLPTLEVGPVAFAWTAGLPDPAADPEG